MNRKDFLKLSGLATAAFFFTNNLAAKALAPKTAIINDDYDVLIIGSGYGGAVSSLRLAQAGKKVLILEMGMDWSTSGLAFSKMAFASKQSTWLRNTTIAPFGNFVYIDKFTGVLDRIDFENVKVYAGRGIGGGSLANGGMSVTPKKEYFEEVFPNLDSEAFYNKYFPLANTELGVNMIPDEFFSRSDFYRFSRVGEVEAKNAGFKTFRVPNVYDYDYMQKEENNEVERSAFAGEVIYGNNHGKKDLTKTYLKKALETGNVTIYALHQVDTITDKGNGNYDIQVNLINTSGEVVGNKTLSTSKLILSAGSLGTTKLLMKSQALGLLPSTNTEIGKYWGNNGNCMAGRNYVNTWVNPVKNAGSDSGNGTGANQSTIPASGVDNWDDPQKPFFAEIAPLPIGMETNAALYLTINRVPHFGEFTYNLSKDDLDLDWGTKHNTNMVENTKYFLDEMNKANGGIYANLLFDRGIGVDICYHPLGGCVLGKATDNFGRVNDMKGLYVLDGSLIPATIGVNPYVTITAITEYCIEHIIKNDFEDKNVLAVNDFGIHKESINVYPNPFTDIINVELSVNNGANIKIDLIDLSGKIVATQSSIGKSTKQILKIEHLSKLAKAPYIVSCNINGKIISKKVIKK
ncbi:MAG: GMC oxidoreductase [Cruoricaptor ignavus]|nr:GMC oxidoreductase [Cruoricaptor ignavus]